MRDDFQPLFLFQTKTVSLLGLVERDSLAQLVIDFPHTALKVQVVFMNVMQCKKRHRPLKNTSREDVEEPTKPSELNAESIEILTITEYSN